MTKVQNPVLPGFHPDPSMICVDGVFYIANSTFEYFPGICLHKSRDLANWEQLPSPLAAEALDLDGLDPSCGVWAPSLSYHDGLFYLAYTVVANHAQASFLDTPNYIVTAGNIEGPWSEPVYVNSSGFDPSLFHAPDGKLWFVQMEWDFRRDANGKFAGIMLTELDRKTFKPVSEHVTICAGSALGLTEAPNLYWKDGWHYLFCAEGGTAYEHAESVFRSPSLMGPYAPCPHNPLLTAYGTGAYLQKAGHAALCEGPDGRWWIAFLCARPLPGTQKCVLGRETAIAEVQWRGGWPMLIAGNAMPPDAFEAYGPKAPERPFECRFDAPRLPRAFCSLRTPPRYSLTENPGKLRLYGGKSPLSRSGQQVIALRQTGFKFIAETALTFSPQRYTSMAGLLYRYDERNQYFFRITRCDDAYVLGLLNINRGECIFPAPESEITLPGNRVCLRLEVDGAQGVFAYSFDGQQFKRYPHTIDTTILSDEYDRYGFTGAMVGLCCVDMQYEVEYADFEYFTYVNK